MAYSKRTAVGGLVLAASTLVGIALKESYTDTAVIPVPGDVPTKGFGTTRHADGSPVTMGEKTTPPRALVDLLADADKFAQAVKRCAPVEMYQYEFNAYVSLTYNIGEGAFCASSIPVKLKAGEYEAACKTILDFDKMRDCTKPKVWDAKKGQLVCPLVPLRGLTIRRQAEYQECIGAKQ